MTPPPRRRADCEARRRRHPGDVTQPRRAPDRRPLAAAALALALAFTATSCTGPDRGDPDPQPAAGPLRSLLSNGGNSLDQPPAATRWDATFGSLLLCTDQPVTLSGVEPRYRTGRPEAITFHVRTVPAGPARTGPPIDWAPVAARAAPLDTLLRRQVKAADVTDVPGTTVDQACDASGADAPYTEILTSMTVGPGGAWIDGLNVTYQADGDEYVLPVNWNYVACGTAIHDANVCEPA